MLALHPYDPHLSGVGSLQCAVPNIRSIPHGITPLFIKHTTIVAPVTTSTMLLYSIFFLIRFMPNGLRSQNVVFVL